MQVGNCRVEDPGSCMAHAAGFESEEGPRSSVRNQVPKNSNVSARLIALGSVPVLRARGRERRDRTQY